ncbi:MAG: heavy metal-associated domain-containing protein [Bacteroidota bacterium]
MKNFLLFTIVLSVLACTSKPEKIHLRTEKGPRTEHSEVNVAANSTVKMEIQGMTCEMGCGGTIRTALKGTEAVARVQYDFKEGAKVQTATISFDNTKISPEKMINIVEKLNDNQFSVGNFEVLTSNNVGTNESDKVTHEEKAVIEMSSSIKLPNLLGILKGLIQR